MGDADAIEFREMCCGLGEDGSVMEKSVMHTQTRALALKENIRRLVNEVFPAMQVIHLIRGMLCSVVCMCIRCIYNICFACV